jgi:hypothetical protein
MTGDPFGPARRSLWLGPLLIAIGTALVVLGRVAVDGAGAWLLIVPGGMFILLGFPRFIGGFAVLRMERRRKEILRDGEPSTGKVNSAKRIGTQSGYPIFKLALEIRGPDGTESIVYKRGAVPPQFADALETGTELPIKIRPSDNAFAIDWDAF